MIYCNYAYNTTKGVIKKAGIFVVDSKFYNLIDFIAYMKDNIIVERNGGVKMILSGFEIKNKMGKDIIIEPFDEKLLNPNSYNLRLHNELLVYEEDILDMKKPNITKSIVIPEEGLELEPGKLYLGRTDRKSTRLNSSHVRISYAVFCL